MRSGVDQNSMFEYSDGVGGAPVTALHRLAAAMGWGGVGWGGGGGCVYSCVYTIDRGVWREMGMSVCVDWESEGGWYWKAVDYGGI